MSVDFVTFCCKKDMAKLHAPGVIGKIVGSHVYGFNNVHIIYQRCVDDVSSFPPVPSWVIQHRSEDYQNILTEYNIEEDQPDADEFTHGPNAAHYWKWHVINHLIGAKVSTADYIVFSDCDCDIKYTQQGLSWVVEAMTILQRYPDVLIVSPSDGGSMAEKTLPGGVRLTQNVSQQLFLVNRKQFRSLDLDIPWNWEFLAPGGPMQEYYYMLEGRIWRYLHRNNMWRAILPEKWRYWHHQW